MSSSYFIYSPVLFFFLFFPPVSLKFKLVYFFSFVEHFLVCGFAIISFFHSLFFLLSLISSFFSLSFHFLFLFLFYSATPFIPLPFFLFLSFLPITIFSVPFSYHPISFFLSFFPFFYHTIFLLSTPHVFLFIFLFSPFKTNRFKNDSLEVHKSWCKSFTPIFAFSVGHGRSEGERVQISSFSIYVADVLKHIDEVLLNNAGLPIFLFGHSMASTLFIVDFFL